MTRVRTYLRVIRGDQRLSEAARLSGLSAGVLSRLERGMLLPEDRWLPRLERVYGSPVDIAWYPPTVERVLKDDWCCPACGKELPPEASSRRVFHDERCRSRYRRQKERAR
jgi:hypothetical protein